MGSLVEAIYGVTGPKPGHVLRNGEWVPEHVASPRRGPVNQPGNRNPDSWNSLDRQILGQGGTLGGQITSQGGTLNTVPLRSTRPEDVDAYVRNNYGYFAGFLNHPEVGKILREAALAEWDESKLYGAITATSWWKNTSAAQRTWQQLTGEDPAEARRQVNQTAATITNKARSLGLNMSSGSIGGLALQATQNGWSDAQTIDMLMEQVNWATLDSGDLTALRDQVTTMAGDYLVGVSAETAQNYAQAMASGEMSPEGVRSAMAKQAKSRFGYLASEIDQGMTVKQYFQPIANRIESELELGSGAVDLTDSKWLSMIEVAGDDGKPRAATLHEATRAARADSRWANTSKAQDTTTDMMNKIGKIFGRSGI